MANKREQILLSIFKCISDDIHVEKINNVNFIFVGTKQRFILTEKQTKTLQWFKDIPLADYGKPKKLYSKGFQLAIGKEIYEGKYNRFEAAEIYQRSPDSCRNYLRAYKASLKVK